MMIFFEHVVNKDPHSCVQCPVPLLISCYICYLPKVSMKTTMIVISANMLANTGVCSHTHTYKRLYSFSGQFNRDICVYHIVLAPCDTHPSSLLLFVGGDMGASIHSETSL